MKPVLIKKSAQQEQAIKAAPSGLNHYEDSLRESAAALKRQRADYNPHAAWRGLWRAQQ